MKYRIINKNDLYHIQYRSLFRWKSYTSTDTKERAQWLIWWHANDKWERRMRKLKYHLPIKTYNNPGDVKKLIISEE